MLPCTSKVIMLYWNDDSLIHCVILLKVLKVITEKDGILMEERCLCLCWSAEFIGILLIGRTTVFLPQTFIAGKNVREVLSPNVWLEC